MSAFGEVLATTEAGGASGRLAWSPDGRWVAAAYWDLLFFGPSPRAPVILLDAATGEVRWRSAEQPACTDLVFSPDGGRLAVAVTTFSQHAEVLVLDAGTGEQVWQRVQPYARRLRFSPDGRLLAVIDDERVRLLDAATGRELFDLGAPIDSGSDTTFSRDSQWYAAAIGSELRLVGTRDGAVRWAAAMPKPVLRAGFTDDESLLVAVTYDTVVTLDAVSGEVRSSVPLEEPVNLILIIDMALELSPDRTRFVRPGRRELALWSLADGRRIRTAAAPSSSGMLGWSMDARVAFSPDGRLIALAPDGAEGTTLLNSATGDIVHRDPAVATSLAFDPAGARLAVGGGGAVRIIDVGVELSRRRFGGRITGVAVSAGGLRMAAVAAGDQPLVVFHADTGATLLEYASSRPVNTLEFGPDGAAYATGGADGFLDVRDVASGRLSSLRHGGAVNDLVFDPSRPGQVVTGSADKTVRMLVLPPPGVSEIQEAWRYTHARAVRMVSAAPGGRWFAAAGGDNVVVVLDASGHEVGRHQHRDRIAALSFGAFLASGGEDGAIFLIDPATGNLIAEISHHRSVTAVAAGPDGAYLVTADAAGLVRLFDTTSGKPVPLRELTYPEKVRRLLFHPVDRRLAVVAEDAPIARIIDPATGTESVRLIHPAPISDLVFSRDGELLATACDDDVARVFPGRWG